MKIKKPYRAAEQLKGLRRGDELMKRVEKGFAHLKRRKLDRLVAVANLDPEKYDDEEYFARLGVKDEEEATALGFRSPDAKTTRFLVRLWTKKFSDEGLN